MPLTQIYTLSDPRTGDIRYVGKTRDAKARIRNHLNKREHNHKGNWIESLRKLNLEPVVTFIDEVATEEWSFWEQHWIQVFRGWGFNLTNMNAGGGEHAYFTPELKAKHKASFTEEVRQDMREKADAHWSDPNIKSRHGTACREAMQRPDIKAKMQKRDDPANKARAEKVRAQWADPTYKAERAAKMRAANARPEVIAKRVANAKKLHADGKFAAIAAKAHAAISKAVVLTKGDEVREFKQLGLAAEFLGVERSTVSRCAAGKFKSDTINGWKVARRAGIEPTTVSLEG